jgi:hypothetical protein
MKLPDFALSGKKGVKISLECEVMVLNGTWEKYWAIILGVGKQSECFALK